ncbi:MAG: type II secretion system protein [Deltaproteobacteria bacterium]|nr:type II secretion system protein [Deltaproteobacteria bacterium]
MARRTVHTFISSRDAWFFGPDRSGFTYLSALILVAVMGIALGAAGRYWSTTVKREKEKELLFRGDQIRRAIESYYLSNPGSGGAKYPLSLAHLLKDPRYHDVRRHLRKLYRDPMTEDAPQERSFPVPVCILQGSIVLRGLEIHCFSRDPSGGWESFETFEKRSILFKVKEDENFNRRNTLSILRIKI